MTFGVYRRAYVRVQDKWAFTLKIYSTGIYKLFILKHF